MRIDLTKKEIQILKDLISLELESQDGLEEFGQEKLIKTLEKIQEKLENVK